MRYIDQLIINLFKKLMYIGMGAVLMITGMVGLVAPIMPGIVLIVLGFTLIMKSQKNYENIGIADSMKMWTKLAYNKCIIINQKYSKKIPKIPFF